VMNRRQSYLLKDENIKESEREYSRVRRSKKVPRKTV